MNYRKIHIAQISVAENLKKVYNITNTRAVPLPVSGDVHNGRVFFINTYIPLDTVIRERYCNEKI